MRSTALPEAWLLVFVRHDVSAEHHESISYIRKLNVARDESAVAKYFSGGNLQLRRHVTCRYELML